MRGRKSIYRKLWRRWLIIEAVSAVVFSIIVLNGDLGLWFVLWLLFSFVSDCFFGPGSMKGRAYNIQKLRDIRELRELNEQWYKDNKKFCDKLTDKECEEFFNSPPSCNDMTGNSGYSHKWYSSDDWD